MIAEYVEDGNWEGLKAGGKGPIIIHLMFADDLLLFGRASEDQILGIMEIMEKFSDSFGQKIRIEKSSIMFSKNVDNHLRRKITQVTKLKEVNGLGTYLRVPHT